MGERDIPEVGSLWRDRDKRYAESANGARIVKVESVGADSVRYRRVGDGSPHGCGWPQAGSSRSRFLKAFERVETAKESK